MCPRPSARGSRAAPRRPEQYAQEPDDDETYYDDLDEDGDPDADDELDDEQALYEEGEEQRDEVERAERGGGRPAEVMAGPLAARAGMRHVADLTGKEPSGITSLEPADDGWLVGVEVVESHRIPSSIDVLGLYLTHVGADGSLVTYRRTRRYLRGRGDGDEGEPR